MPGHVLAADSGEEAPPSQGGGDNELSAEAELLWEDTWGSLNAFLEAATSTPSLCSTAGSLSRPSPSIPWTTTHSGGRLK